MTHYKITHTGYYVVATDQKDALRQFLSNLNKIGTYTAGWTVTDTNFGNETYHATQEVAVFPEIGEMGVEYRELKEKISTLQKRVVVLEVENAALRSGDSAPETQLDPNREVMAICNCGCGSEFPATAETAVAVGWKFREMTDKEREELKDPESEEPDDNF